MYSTKQNVLQLIALLKSHNINKFVVSPGSRHIPIVLSMESDSFFKLYSVVDERSASFFAIGLIQRFNEPVGLICTSGTASANYCSAISEAYYQELPLLVLTADRLPCFLDQHEDQMIHQSTMYTNITKMVINLPIVNNSQDAWYNNRLINEALLELRHHGDGPVQINIPVEDHNDEFSVPTLPIERKIVRHDLSEGEKFWQGIANLLKSKKIIVVCGQGAMMTETETLILDDFCHKFDCVVLADKMSNCHVKNSVENAFAVLGAMSWGDIADTVPDLVISIRSNYSFNPEFKGFLKHMTTYKMENWFISASGKIIDPFRRLTKVFEMNEFLFFQKVAQCQMEEMLEQPYADIWTIISSSIEEPQVDYSHIYTIAKFIPSLPQNSVLHLSNSNSVRVAQLFNIDPTIEVHCNRGTDGIDGCMSTMVGFASETDKLVFLMIGDLTFFYDMNALWNRQLGKNIRIILSNNGGGAIMHMPKRPDFALQLLPNYISAQHNASAKAWAEDCGFTYLAAHNESEVDKGIAILTDVTMEGPIILEVFTDMLADTKILKEYYTTISRSTLEDKLRNKAGILKQKIFKILGLK